MSDRLEAAGGVKPRSNFMRDGFVLDEAVFAARLNGLFVKALSIQLATFDSRNLGSDQCCAIPEILGTILCPHNHLLVMGGECLTISDLLIGRCGVVPCRPGECAVEN